MKLQQAIYYFGKVALDGWDGGLWVENIAYGDLLTYDRFIGPRSFGHKQRLFTIGGDGADLAGFDIVRTAEDQRNYIVMSKNHDIKDEGIYATTFMLQYAPFSCAVTRFDTQNAPSGIPGIATRVEVLTTMCDIERYNSEDSRNLDTVRYGIYIVTMPKDALLLVDVDMEIRINNIDYEIKEIYPNLDAAEMRVLKRG